MSITQFYKSQVLLGANLIPIPAGGASLSWPKNYVAPTIAGNYWSINYIEGLQTPTMNASVVLLDGTTTNCPLFHTTMNAIFMTRSTTSAHDTTKISSGVQFFDGSSGFNFPDAKANSFSIQGSKGSDVSFSMGVMAYDTTGGGANVPVALAAAPTTYTAFSGSPIRFQSLRFYKGANEGAKACWDGVMSFSLTFSNNCTPDLSMVGCPGSSGQNVLPVDVNAGMQSCAAQFTLQAHESPPATGEYIEIQVVQGAISTKFKLANILVETTNDRNVGAGRQTRSYSCQVLGTSNTVPPLTIAAGP